MKVFAVIHGQTNMDAEERLQSRSDTSLTEAGKAQALETAKALESVGIDMFLVSPERRCLETSAIIAEHLGVSDDKIANGLRLHERDYGDLEGQHIYEVDIFALNCWEINAKTPNGEEIRDAAIRVMTYMNSMVQLFHNKTLLMVVPPNVLRILFWYFTGLPEYGKSTLEKYEPGMIYEFDTDSMPAEMSNYAAIMNKLDPAGSGYRSRVLVQDEIDSVIDEMGISLSRVLSQLEIDTLVKELGITLD